MTDTAQVVHQLRASDSGCGDIRISAGSYHLTLEYEYWPESNSGKAVGGIKFKGASALRFRDEMHSGGFAELGFDALVEIIDSSWCQELSKIEPENILGGVRPKHHFAVFLSNNGYLEVVADGFEELQGYQGSLLLV